MPAPSRRPDSQGDRPLGPVELSTSVRLSLRRGDRKYCTFTYHGFRGDLSISIITSPETAAEATTLLEEHNPQWTGHKGAGDVTVGGELIMDEWAVLVGMLNAPPGIDRSHLKILDAFAFERLGDQQRKRVSEMATAPDRDMINGIFHTNSFGITLADEANHRALFPEIARINHDCRPSCHVRYSRHELRMEVFAYRDIKAGEELSVAYTPLNLPTKARQEAIQGWGFNCTCSLCTEPELSETSDRNRQRIQDLVRDMAKVENRNRDAMRVITDQLVALMETEELTAMMGTCTACSPWRIPS
ncbi:unnamed protein product [Parascedosporium putredinis]|uniref:SET domain-containing protein n=1 Tax=Parascedosporium putredinis TaxID=1442378 RepID=A0A9P1M9M7_9PEZI|nr:unnamed protein product [Parascedosporium putredinis]CAI7992332.1 unnamed protein product [Parascedosporium putredinis]